MKRSPLALSLWLAACSGNDPVFTPGAELPPEESINPIEPPPVATMTPGSMTPGGGGTGNETPPPGEDMLPPVMMLPGEPDDGEDMEPAPEPEGDTTPPTIVSVSPEDNATGVDVDVELVITFSEPMERASAEAAYLSEELPSAGVSFSWNDDSTVMTVIPNSPLTLPSGTDPEQVTGRTYRYVILGIAKDLEGNALVGAPLFSFTSLRELRRVIGSQQNRNLTGNYRANNSYGTDDCERDNNSSVCIGDSDNVQNTQYKGFITFDLGDVPDGTLRVGMAELKLEITGTAGAPFSGLGNLIGEHAQFAQINMNAFNAAPLGTLGVLANQGGAGTLLSMDVRTAVVADLAAGRSTQFRFTFQRATDADRDFDVVNSDWSTHELSVSFVVP